MTSVLRMSFLLGLVLVLAGCLADPAPIGDPPKPEPDDGSCTYVLAEDITVPSKLINTPKACDYVLEGSVYIKSRLVIEPGVVRANKDALIAVDGGEFLAVGNAQNRIIFEGQNHLAGYWEGVRFRDGRESRLEYVDIKDAGQDECVTVFWCNKAGLVLDDVTVSLVQSSVSNSYVNGLVIGEAVVLSAFANNRFYGNSWAGIVVNGEHVDELDVASDHSGGAEPNGTVYVKVSGDLEAGNERVWKKLNAPYLNELRPEASLGVSACT